VAKIFESTVVNAPADEVWKVIGDFNGLPEWLPGIVSSEIRGGGPANEPGAVRVLTLPEGPPVVELLHGISSRERSMTYEILESSLGIANYVSTLSVRPVTDGNRAYIEWSADFDAEPGQDASERAQFIATVIYGAGLNALKERFGG
jgi:hypothetical protein